jgi:regulator of protease activity HflC (stomatin/prohibitin superfamily)
MELVDITPEDSVVPVYLEVLNEEEQTIRDAELAQAQADQKAREAERIAKEEAKANGMAKLIALGLTEEEAKALTNGL